MKPWTWLLGALAAAGLNAGLALAQSEPVASVETDLADRLVEACQTLAAAPAMKTTGRVEDLELFWLAELLDYEDQGFEARRVRRYLAAYWPRSPLLPLLPPLKSEGELLSDFTPDPAWSRTVKAFYLWLGREETTDALDLDAAVALSLAWLQAVGEGGALPDFAALVNEFPESRFAGWAVYLQAWSHWLETDGDLAGFAALRARHPEHPLAAEAAEAALVPHFDPRSLAQRSSLLPGWGEELLEPGMREASSQLYSELLFLAGAVGFAVASQNQSRQENLTGAAIFANLLFLNHQGSAERVWELAQRRNWAERNRFLQERLEAPIMGPGRFQPLSWPKPAAEPMASEAEISLLLKLRGVDEGFRGQGWVRDDELANLGWQVRYRRSVLQTAGQGPLSAALAVAPRLKLVYTQARTTAPDLFRDPLRSTEWGLGAELLGLVRWSWGSWRIQGSFGAGPIWRQRSLSFAPFSHTDQGPALAADAGLEWGGPSGTFCQAAVWYEDDFQQRAVAAGPGRVGIPGTGLGLQFSLGVRF
ncbi:MAG: hypothetical protein AB1439_06095 [candidate division FCPU426 bacterium]